MPQLVSPTGQDIPLRPVRANSGIEAAYRRALFGMIDEMHASVMYWLRASYKADEPAVAALATDAGPAFHLRRAIQKLRDRWEKKFDEGAQHLAEMFADKARLYSDVALARTLKEAGFSVQFKMTPAMKDVFQATVTENVNLIKSIASQHLTQVETVVMQSVQRGRDLETLTKELQARFGSTKKRATLIARDQNNKITANLTRARQLDLGIKQARWRHSSAGKEPRISHVKASQENGGKGLLFDLAKGAYIDGKYILPGEEINCRCSAVPIIPGFINE